MTAYRFEPVNGHKPGDRRRLRRALRQVNGGCAKCRVQVRFWRIDDGIASCPNGCGETFTIREHAEVPGRWLPAGIVLTEVPL